MALFTAQAYQALDERLSLAQRLALLHTRLQRLVPSIHRVAFALYQPGNDLLSTYISHNSHPPNLTFYDHRLASIPSLKHLAATRQCRVIHDMALELPRISAHTRWLLEQRWRSSYTVPLYWGGELLGFLFFNAFEPGVFTPEHLEQLAPCVELIGALLIHEVAVMNSLRVAVKLALRMTGLRDPETGAHVERVSLYSRLIAMALGPKLGLRTDFAEDLYLFAALHDVGKVAIPDAVLRKPGPLDPPERRVMDNHVVRGVELVDQMIAGLHLVADPKMEQLRNVVAGHHEKLDGSGYPFGLQGEQISLEARIVAVADIYDALTQARVYKPDLSEEESLRILNDMVQAHHLDPLCVAALLEASEQRQAIAAAYRDP